MSAAVFTDVATVSAAEITSATLAPPTTVAAEFSCSSGEATITWTAAADADGYELHRRTGNSADFAAIGTTSSTSLTDTTVQLDTTYEYVVVATARSWTSDPSMPPAQLTTAASC